MDRIKLFSHQPSFLGVFTAFTVAAACLVTDSVDAAIVVVDPAFENGPGDIYNSNGSFEFNDSGNEHTTDNVDSAFWQTGSGVGTKAVQSEQTRNNLPGSEGSHSMVMGTEGGGDSLGGLLNTMYVVQEGDTFDLSFDWRAASGWDAANDLIEYYLFTSNDNTLGGTKTTLLSGSVSGNPESYQSVDPANVTVAPLSASIGQQLWVEFSSNTNSNGEFARLDNVQLTVTPVPEPASLALLVTGSLIMLGRSRRHS